MKIATLSSFDMFIINELGNWFSTLKYIWVPINPTTWKAVKQ